MVICVEDHTDDDRTIYHYRKTCKFFKKSYFISRSMFVATPDCLHFWEYLFGDDILGAFIAGFRGLGVYFFHNWSPNIIIEYFYGNLLMVGNL